MTSLNGRERRALRARAHDLAPVVQVGREGLHEALVEAVDTALFDHELIKVRLPQVEKAERLALAADLSRATEAGQVGLTGRVLILYKPRPEDPPGADESPD